MGKLKGIHPLHEKRRANILLRAEKYKSFPDHPMKTRLHGFAKNWLNSDSFVHVSKRLDRLVVPDLTITTTSLCSADITDPIGNDLSTVELRLAVPQLDTGTKESEGKKRSITLAMLD